MNTKNFLLGLFAGVALIAFLLNASVVRASSTIFTVTTTANAGLGSLRQAIIDANGNSGPDTIVFNIPGAGPYTITPTGAMPNITDPVTIDGTSQPGYAGTPVIELNGMSAGRADGLAINAGNSTVRGLAINRFGLSGILLESKGDNIVEGNFIGTDVSGSKVLGNSGVGLEIKVSSNNMIGGTAPDARNIISGNGGPGLLISSSAYSNTVVGNFIGTDITGTQTSDAFGKSFGNSGDGILITAVIGFADYASDNVIGGTNPGAGNVISNNGLQGIVIVGGVRNRVQGNSIGTDVTGTIALGNAGDGVLITNGASDNIIGGTSDGVRNIISANKKHGVEIFGGDRGNAPHNLVAGNFIGTDVTGTKPLGNTSDGVAVTNASDNTIGGTTAGARNLISANRLGGVTLICGRATGNVVQGNFIGTDVSGARPLGNQGDGLLLTSISANECAGSATLNIIGGTVAEARNIISDNNGYGVEIGFGASGNTIQGNFIGTDAKGQLPLGNASAGVAIFDSPNNTVGGTEPGARNIIADNDKEGVRISVGAAGGGATGNVVQGNFIGINASGTTNLGNHLDGVAILGSPNNTIGGTTPEARNVIAGNDKDGVRISGASATGNTVQGNYIGVRWDGATALPNGAAGVEIANGAAQNIIGGARPSIQCNGPCNVLSGNTGDGVSLGGTGTISNTVQGNYIGVRPDGIAPLPNSASGIGMRDGAAHNIIGGTRASGDCVGPCNLISGNRRAGVTVSGVSSLGDTIRGNNIHDNGGLGIDLVGNDRPDNNVTPNDTAGDIDHGPNELMNFPVGVTAYADTKNNITTISGIVSTLGPQFATVDIYGSATGDPSGFGEGQIYLGSVGRGTSTPINSDGTFVLTRTGILPFAISATATDANGSTSEFSPVCGDPDGDGNSDDDGDGLCDDWESTGIDFNGDAIVDLNLPALGASPDHKDLFVEIDYMVAGDHSHKPDDPALDMVKTAFAHAPIANPDHVDGIALHLLVDEPISEAAPILFGADGPGAADDFSDLKLGSNDPARPGVPCGVSPVDGHFGTQSDRLAFGAEPTCPNILGAKRLVYRYAIFGHNFKEKLGDPPTSNPGVSEDPSDSLGYYGGDDLLVTLRPENKQLSQEVAAASHTSFDQEWQDVQAAIFMHELGHTLGLDHGGDEAINCKPQYLSVMNYVYTYNRFALIDSTAPTLLNAPDGLDLNHDGRVDTIRVQRRLDYSRGQMAALDEDSLDENSGIDGPTTMRFLFGIDGKGRVGISQGAVDWNGNGRIDAGRVVDDVNYIEHIDDCPSSPGDSLTDYNDWANLLYDFRSSPGFANGPPLVGSHHPDPTVDDYQNQVLEELVPTFSVTNVNDSGPGSLRQAILHANARPGPDMIDFKLPGVGPFSIQPSSALPTITDPISIDGTTQPGFAGAPIVELSGASAGADADGLLFTAGSSTVKGLVINHFGHAGIVIQSNGGNTIAGNFIGTDITGKITDPDGTPQSSDEIGNYYDGVLIQNSPNNMIGGIVPEARNIISGNGYRGIRISGSFAVSNTVQGNFIGTDVTGNTRLGNGDIDPSSTAGYGNGGILIEDAPNNRIGGVTPEERNVISGNTFRGISIIGARATGNEIQGNFIGTDVAGTANVGTLNQHSGVMIKQASSSTIGGTAEGTRNIISGNLKSGILIDTGAGNIVQGNFIGTDVTGTRVLDTGFGITIVRGSLNTIGGTVVGARNIISGNRDGIYIDTGTGNMIEGNFIGTDVTGTRALGNKDYGIEIEGGANNTIGGTIPAARNIISSNYTAGIEIGLFASGTLIAGNFIGTDLTGLVTDPDGVPDSGDELGNGLRVGYIGCCGIDISGGGTVNNTIGGTISGAGNVIAGNFTGIVFGDGANQNRVQGNFIGTDLTGTRDLGNHQQGILIYDAGDNIIGGTTVGSRNIISGNGEDGVLIYGHPTIESNRAKRNVVQGNFIGTDVTGEEPLGNGGMGVRLGGIVINEPGGRWSFDNTIGGTAAGASNIIAFNDHAGVSVLGGTGNAILSNAIFSNADLGIDLGSDGVTANDAGDGDIGANNLQNSPTLTTISSTSAQGTLNSTPNTTFSLEFFASTTCDPSGYGEGQAFLGATTATTDGRGDATFTIAFPTTVPADQFITATATDPNKSTSEFSRCRPVTSPPINRPPVAIDAVVTTTQDTPITITLSASDPNGDSLTFSVITGPTHGTLSGAAPNLTYTPSPGYSGLDSFTFTANDGHVDSNSATVTITVPHPNQPPSASTGGPYTALEGIPITLGASGSRDTDGTITRYEWDLDNDGQYDDATGITTSVTFGDNGIFAVGLRVTDDKGATATASAIVTATNVAPIATFIAPQSVVEGSPISLTLTTPVDVAADLPSLQYAFDCGDGAGYGSFGASSTATCSTTSAGPRTVRAKVRDKDGGLTEYTATVIVMSGGHIPCIADTYVEREHPNTSHGTSRKLEADADSEAWIFLKCRVPDGISRQHVKLRLYVVESSPRGGDFYQVTDNWDENITWKTRPRNLGPKIAQIGRVKRGTFVEVDVTPGVQANGIISLAIRTSSDEDVEYASREASNEQTPQLIVEG